VQPRLPDAKLNTLRETVLRTVEPGSTVSTDEWMSYGLLKGDDYTHGVVKHGAKEYVRETDGVSHQNALQSCAKSHSSAGTGRPFLHRQCRRARAENG
jgi:ISXO2-like transposase domain